MAAYVSVRIEKIADRGAIGQTAHDWRTKPPAYLRQNPCAYVYTWKYGQTTIDRQEIELSADEKRRQLDQIRDLIGAEIKAADKRYTETVGQRPQRSAKHFRRGIITFSPGIWADMPDDDRVKYCAELMTRGRDLIETICKKYGASPIYAALHIDETTPHIHFLMTNTNREGKSISRVITPQSLREVQDAAGDIYKSMGYQRGISRDVTGARHKTVREIHRVEQERLEAVTAEMTRTTNELRRRRHEAEEKAADMIGVCDRLDMARKETEADLAKIKKTKDQAEADLRDAQRAAGTASAVKIKAESEKEKAEAELERIKDELRQMRLTLDEQNKLSREERRKYNEEVRRRREEQKRLREAIRSFKQDGYDRAEAEKHLGKGDPEKEAMAAEILDMRNYLAQREQLQDYEDWAAAYRSATANEIDEPDGGSQGLFALLGEMGR